MQEAVTGKERRADEQKLQQRFTKQQRARHHCRTRRTSRITSGQHIHFGRQELGRRDVIARNIGRAFLLELQSRRRLDDFRTPPSERLLGNRGTVIHELRTCCIILASG